MNYTTVAALLKLIATLNDTQEDLKQGALAIDTVNITFSLNDSTITLLFDDNDGFFLEMV